MTLRQPPGWRLFMACLLYALVVNTAMTETVHAALPPAADAAATNPADPASQEAAQTAERKRKLRLAIITGGLIAVTGVALVALTMLGGSATRRGLRRKPLAEGPPPLDPIPADRFDEQETVRGDELPESRPLPPNGGAS